MKNIFGSDGHNDNHMFVILNSLIALLPKQTSGIELI